MATYKVKHGNKTYRYEKPRELYPNNSTEYNQEYYKNNKARLQRAKIKKAVLDRLDEILPKKRESKV